MQTIVITGGTGLVGKALSKQLIAKGYNVIILTRNKPTTPNPKGIEFAEWNVEKKFIDIKAIQKADHIIHLAGAGVMDKRWTDEYKKQIVESRTKSSELIIETLKNNINKVQTIVSASAIG